MSDDSREDRIRTRAYAIWEYEGKPSGRHDEHWGRRNATSMTKIGDL